MYPERDKAHKDKYINKIRKPACIVTRVCICGCKQEFTVNMSDNGASQRLYFSRSCKDKVNYAKHRKTFEPIACEVCGQTFTPDKITTKTCSAECRAERKREWRRTHETKRVKPATPQYRKESTLAGSGVKNVKRLAHVVSRERKRQDDLYLATLEPDYNPRFPEVYIQRVLARQAA
jgi:hypothetical protein